MCIESTTDNLRNPLSDTSTNEILEGQFKPLKSIIHFENGRLQILNADNMYLYIQPTPPLTTHP